MLSKVKGALATAMRSSIIRGKKTRLVIDCIGYASVAVMLGFLVLMAYANYGGSSLRGLESHIAPVPPKIMSATLVEVQAVVERDQTDKVAPGTGFNCVDYAWAVKRALQWEGINSAILGLQWAGVKQEGHALLLIPTSDKGWVALEPQSDKFMPVPKVGDRYEGREIGKIIVLVLNWVDVTEFEQNPVFEYMGGE